jgi:sterol desaturase/sphingolipid hydroxylase (fatty acid hydroxylase superfamily)
MEQHIDVIAITIFVTIYTIFEDPWGVYRGKEARPIRANLIEATCLICLVLIVKPAIGVISFQVLQGFFPTGTGNLNTFNLAVGVVCYILIDDFLHYNYHRLAHVVPFFWALHRSHHSAQSMGVLVTYRNGFFFYLMMPNIWFGGVAIWAGFGKVVGIGLAIKLIVIVSSHSKYLWDKFFYDRPSLNWLSSIFERIIVTPCTHRAHHGKTIEDGISNPNGNFGNMLFIWDIIFRTGKITRKYPTVYGILNDEAVDSWYSEVFYPVIRSKDPNSELY